MYELLWSEPPWFSHKIITDYVRFDADTYFSECLKEWADEIHHVGMVVRETLLVQLSAVEAENK